LSVQRWVGDPSPQKQVEIRDVVEESKKAAEAAIRRFDEAARRSLLSTEHRLVRTIGMEAPTLFAAIARRFDLSICLQSRPDGVANDDMIESSLFESGRPVIVVPYIDKDGLQLERVVCCWDGGRAAARAINDALPLLAKADKVDLLIIENDKTKNETAEIRGVEMARHLARATTSRSRSRSSRRRMPTRRMRSCLTLPMNPEP
jgi:hypothetical protein